MANPEVIYGCMQGDRKSQKLLYEQYSGQMYSICLRYCTRVDFATDALQEAFINVFRNIGQYKKEVDIKYWIRKIVIRSCLNILRKESKSINLNVEEDMIAETGYLQDIDFDNFNYQRMIDHIDNLPDGCRTVFCMYVLDDLAHGEIAELLGIGESSSRSQLFKARKLLQELINQDQLLLTELKHIK